MYQESNASKSSKKSDALLFIGLIFMLFLARALLNFIQTLQSGRWLQVVIFVALVAICFIVFKKRFCTYRYTLFHKEPEKGDLDPYGNQQKLPCPLGTFIIEQMSGSRGGIMETIAPGEFVRLISPEADTAGVMCEKLDESLLKKPPLYGNGDRKSAYILLYRRDSRMKALAFCPSDKLVSMLNEIISAVNA